MTHPMQREFDAISESHRQVRVQYHLTLEKLIQALENRPPETLYVTFDDGIPVCGWPHSYRGYYSDLAFGDLKQPLTCKTFLTILQEDVLNETFSGYRGAPSK